MKNPRTLAQLKSDPRVREVYSEGDSSEIDGKTWWVELNSGWINSEGGTHGIHERTIKVACEYMDFVKICDCSDCQKMAKL